MLKTQHLNILEIQVSGYNRKQINKKIMNSKVRKHNKSLTYLEM